MIVRLPRKGHTRGSRVSGIPSLRPGLVLRLWQCAKENNGWRVGPGSLPSRGDHFRYRGHKDEIEEQIHPSKPAVNAGIGDPKVRCLYETLKNKC